MADAAVRTAKPDDVAEIARLHRETWRVAYRDLLPAEVLDTLDATDAWADAVEGGQVLVATEGQWTVGFCLAGAAPADETAAADGTVPDDVKTTAMVSLLVEPRWARRGHGGRLLTAAAETLHNNGFTRGIAWVPEADAASKAFYEKVGWAADGTVRTLDAGGRPVREIRVSGGLTPLPGA